MGYRVPTISSGGGAGSSQGSPGSALSLALHISQDLREGSATFPLLPNSEPHSQMSATNLPCQGQVYNLTAYIIYVNLLLKSQNECEYLQLFVQAAGTFPHESPQFRTQCTKNIRNSHKCKKKGEVKLEGLRTSIKKLPRRGLPTAASNPFLGNGVAHC